MRLVEKENLLGQNSSFVTELKPSKNHGIASSTKWNKNADML